MEGASPQGVAPADAPVNGASPSPPVEGVVEAATADAGDDPALADAIEALFPEDAPPEHECHVRVQYLATHKWPHACFTYPRGRDGVRYQATLANCGTEELTKRVCRALFLKVEAGATSDEAKEFRDTLQKQLRELREGPKLKLKRQKSNAGPPKPPRGRASLIGYDRCNHNLSFTFKENEEDTKASKITFGLKSCGGFLEALRLARLVATRCEAGGSQAELLEYRDELLRRGPTDEEAPDDGTTNLTQGCSDAWAEIRAAGEPERGAARPKRDPPGEAGGQAKDGQPAAGEQGDTSANDARPKEKRPKLAEIASGAPAASAPEGAPPGHVAWEKLKFNGPFEDGRSSYWSFEFRTADGQRMKLQAACSAAGSEELAQRVASLCWMKFEEGASQDEVKQYRKELYARCRNSLPAEGGQQKRAAEARGEERPQKRQNTGSDDAIAKLRAQGKLSGAILLEGRDVQRKNSSINGVYAPVEGGFGGARAYKKVGAEGKESRVMFYSSRKSRWKINDALDDEKGGFAWTKIKHEGRVAPHEAKERLIWQVFDGKEDGYNEDPAVRCRLVDVKEEEKDEKLKDEKLKKEDPLQEQNNRLKEEFKAEAKKEAKEEDADSASSTDDESAASGSSSSSASSPPTPKGSPPPDAAKTVEIVNGAKEHDPVAARSPVATPMATRICAKMLVRSGLRCGCHFAYMRDCPDARS